MDKKKPVLVNHLNPLSDSDSSFDVEPVLLSEEGNPILNGDEVIQQFLSSVRDNHRSRWPRSSFAGSYLHSHLVFGFGDIYDRIGKVAKHKDMVGLIQFMPEPQGNSKTSAIDSLGKFSDGVFDILKGQLKELAEIHIKDQFRLGDFNLNRMPSYPGSKSNEGPIKESFKSLQWESNGTLKLPFVVKQPYRMSSLPDRDPRYLHGMQLGNRIRAHVRKGPNDIDYLNDNTGLESWVVIGVDKPTFDRKIEMDKIQSKSRFLRPTVDPIVVIG